MRLEEQIKEIIIERIGAGLQASDIADDQPLFEGAPGSLGLDSVEALELVVGLEERFGIRIEGSEGIIERFFSVATLADLVKELQEKRLLES
jgi:acyl carrier protein